MLNFRRLGQINILYKGVPKIIIGIVKVIMTLSLCALSSIFLILLFSTVHWPAYNTSHVLQAVTIAAAILAILYLAVLDYWRGYHGSHAESPYKISNISDRFLYVLSAAGLSVFTTVMLCIPLAASKLYVGGISIDQQFRTEFLTRSQDSWALHDMTYAHLPSYYPSMWYWIGGKAAKLFHLPAWEMMKPYSILTLSLTAAIIFLWWRTLQAGSAIWLSLATVLACLPFAEEPYSTALAMLITPAMFAFWKEISRQHTSLEDFSQSNHEITWLSMANTHSKNSVCTAGIIAGGIVLGIAIASYTLYAAVYILMLILLVLYRMYSEKRNLTLQLRRLCRQMGWIIILGAIIGVPWWLPFFSALVHDPTALWQRGSANSYLPLSGAELWLPFMQISILGLICLLGLIWIITNFRAVSFATASGISVCACYLWQLLSLILSIFGTTLLSFRMEPIITILLSCAGIMCLEYLLRSKINPWFAEGLNSAKAFHIRHLILLSIVFIAWSQFIPHMLAAGIDLAYSDTDGYGKRADKRSPSVAQYYPQVHQIIQQYTHQPEHNLIVSTSEYGFLSLYPYYGFQSLTPHYANPLANFSARNAQLIDWSHAENAADFQSMLHLSAHTQAVPQIWIFRKDQSGNYVLRLSKDVFPNDPNVQRFTVSFSPELFDTQHYAKKTCGPFTIVLQKSLEKT